MLKYTYVKWVNNNNNIILQLKLRIINLWILGGNFEKR